MSEASERLITTLSGVFAEGEPGRVDRSTLDRLTAALGEIADPSLTGKMVAREGVAADFEGVDGLADVWSDWLGAFDEVRFAIDDVIDADPHVVTLVRQIGVPPGSTKTIENPSAAVWTFREGRVVHVEFHLVPEQALRSAGLDPQSRQE